MCSFTPSATCLSSSASDIYAGHFLAVGWSDGHVRLMGLENNKAVHHIRVSEDTSSKITHIGWSCNIPGKPETRGRGQGQKSANSARSWRDAVSEEFSTGDKPDFDPIDLPRELTFLEIDASLPKISPLPAGSAGAGYV